MKANELMIGDWVRCTDPTPFKIEAITIIDFPEYVTGNDGFDVEVSDLQPIPLTEEILEKNGMAGLYGSNWPSDEYPNIELTSYEDGRLSWTINYNEYDVMSFEYVHELQHALRLCGVEKEIVLN